MKRHPLSSWSKSRLQVVLAVFFVALAVPTTALVAYAYSQLKWEAFHRERGLAEELVKRIDRRLNQVITSENARPFTDYSYLNVVAGTAKSNLLRRSPLSLYPVNTGVSMTLGYFQIDHNGRFSTPLLPDDKGEASQAFEINAPEYKARIALRDSMLTVLSQNQLIASKVPQANEQDLDTAKGDLRIAAVKEGKRAFRDSASSRLSAKDDKVEAQAGFEKLKSKQIESPVQQKTKGLGRLEELKLNQEYEQKAKSRRNVKKKKFSKNVQRLRKEQNILPQRQAILEDVNRPVKHGTVAINMFESEIDELDFSVLDSGHFVLFRKVWKDGKRLIQGVLYEPNAFIESIIRPAFYETTVSHSSDLTVAFEGNILSVLASQSTDNYRSQPSGLEGFLLLDGRLSEPFSAMNLVFSANQVPAGPGGTIVNWLALILLLVFCSGFMLMYRLGLRQITLARQQQDFISAVSHELKTPLTSIRMYGEMLIKGWVGEEKRKQYYGFIFDESERLTRLINNVLQMARMTRNELHLDIQAYSAVQLRDTIQSKVSSQIDRAGFTLSIRGDGEVDDTIIEVDLDYFIQIVINLVDNAVKFSAKSDIKKIDISYLLSNGKLQWRIRDYGPGIPNNQMRKIFELFYRSENELTRETLGTGIGLALVTELVHAMQGSIDVVNQSPGAEFQLSFLTK